MMSTPVRIAAIAAIAIASFLAGTWYSRKPENSTAAQAGRRILYYRDPMHPAYRSDKPGVAPDCGMELEPVYADGGDAAAPAKAAMPAGMVQISPDKQQMIGVKKEAVARRAETHAVRLLGRVALDETRVVRVSAAVDGWVREAGPITTGTIVKKDQMLATFYNRDFLTAQQTYLYALNTMDRFQDTESEDQLKLTKAQMQAAGENLEFLGMSETQLREVARTRQAARNIELRSPVAGLVLARNAFPGLRFDRGTELYRVVDLTHVWILADLFGREANYVRSGQTAKVFLPGTGQTITARFSDTLPQFDAASRAIKVRLEADNPGLALRPDMFVDVEFPVSLPAGISVPADAVIDSGLKSVVFVDRGGGLFEPRQVETGWRLGERIGITRGLEPGDQVVVSGNFLLDSESRMKLAELGAQADRKQGAAAKDPVCGMDLDPAKPAATSQYGGATYTFCSDHCKRKFDENPGAYVKKGRAGAA